MGISNKPVTTKPVTTTLNPPTVVLDTAVNAANSFKPAQVPTEGLKDMLDSFRVKAEEYRGQNKLKHCGVANYVAPGNGSNNNGLNIGLGFNNSKGSPSDDSVQSGLQWLGLKGYNNMMNGNDGDSLYVVETPLESVWNQTVELNFGELAPVKPNQINVPEEKKSKSNGEEEFLYVVEHAPAPTPVAVPMMVGFDADQRSPIETVEIHDDEVPVELESN